MERKQIRLNDHARSILINELPDDILSAIISQLPFKQAVSTSVLSRRWRYLWQGISRFEFIIPVTTSPAAANLLASQLNPIISPTTLLNPQIRSCTVGNFSGVEGTWIQFFLEHKGLEDLCLVGKRDSLPVGIDFGKGKLWKLKLVKYKVSSKDFKSFANLRTLELEDMVGPFGVTMAKILSICPSLKNLFLKGRNNMRTLSVGVDDKLEVLEIKSMSFLELCIKGDALRVIRLQGVECYQKLSICCPNVQELSLCNHNNIAQARELLERCSGVIRGTGIEFDDSPTHMENLKVLCTILDLNNNRDNIVLAYGFKAWRHLEAFGDTVHQKSGRLRIRSIYIAIS